MAKRQAIRQEGQDAEKTFLVLVPNSRLSDNAKLGDVIVTLDDSTEHYVEVKECHATTVQAGTINQVRAIKFITCVVWAPNQQRWYILSPDQLVRLAATKNRGQHTEIPFESMNFTLRTLPDEFHSKATDAELASAVQAAIRRGNASAGLKELMQSLQKEIVKVKDRYIEEVLSLDTP